MAVCITLDDGTQHIRTGRSALKFDIEDELLVADLAHHDPVSMADALF